MSQWTGQTLLALVGGFALAFVPVLPFVARGYRIRGSVGVGRAVTGLAFLVYALALVTYTLLPQPVVDAGFRAANTAPAHPVRNPLEFVADMRKFHTGVLSNPALQQVVFNAALFVPWGFFQRRGTTRPGSGHRHGTAADCRQVPGPGEGRYLHGTRSARSSGMSTGPGSKTVVAAPSSTGVRSR